MKKALSIILVISMLLSMLTLPAFSEGTETVTITKDVTWNDGEAIGPVTISGGTEEDPIVITVNGTVTVNGQISLDKTVMNHVVFTGNGTLVRGTNLTNKAIIRADGSYRMHQSLKVENLTLDGGAVWTGEEHAILGRGTTNSGIQTVDWESGLIVLWFTDAILDNVTLQNQASDQVTNSALYLRFSQLILKNSVVRNNYHGVNRGGAIHMRNGSGVIAENTEFYGNHGAEGGVIGTSSSKAYASVMEFTNCSFTNNYANGSGAVFHTQDNQRYGHLNITNCTITGNGCKTKDNGMIHSSSYTVPVHIKNSTISDNDCNIFGYTSNLNKNLFISNSTITSEYTGTLSEVPFQIYGQIGSLSLNEATVKHLMSKYGYVATEAEGYTITAADVAKLLGDGVEYTKADADGNGSLDIIPGTFDNVSVTVYDNFPGSTASETQSIPANHFPTLNYAHEGYVFNGWVDKNGAAIAKASDCTEFYAQWKVETPEVTIDSNNKVVIGFVDYTLSIVDFPNRADNVTYTYQWYLDLNKIDGATEPSLTTHGDAIGTHYYTCKITAAQEGFVTSATEVTNTVCVTVLPVPVIPDYVAKIGETYYETLTEAVADANKLGTATIEMLKSIDFDSDAALEVTGDVTIVGNHTISRGDYTGTLFTVPAGATLTLDGGLTIDGGNNWTMDKEAYEKDLYDMTQVPKEECEKYFTFEEGSTKATDFMITTAGGTVNLKGVTVQNNYSTNSGIIKTTAAGSVVNLNGATISHIASAIGNGVVVHSEQANTINMYAGTLIDGNHVGGNHGLFKLYGGTLLTMNGGEISNTTGWNSNGTAIGVYNSEFIMNGGVICGNSSVWGTDNQRNPAVYIHSNGKMTMNGGTICHNVGKEYGGGIASYKSSSNIVINYGVVIDNKSLNNENRTGEYVERGDDVDVAYEEIILIYGGIYTHDVDEYCAPGYTCIPYDKTERSDDFIVVNYYEINYYSVDQNGTVALLRTDKLPVPLEGAAVIGNANKFVYNDTESETFIDTWYTEQFCVNQYNFDSEVVENVHLYGKIQKVFKPLTESVSGKVYFDGDLSGGEFEFTLTGDIDGDGKPEQFTATNNGNGEFTFSVKFDNPGTYEFTVEQVVYEGSKVIYDSSTYDVTVIVDNVGGTAIISDEIVYHNSAYGNASVDFGGEVYLDGNPADGFTFILSGNGTTVRATSENGVFDFGSFEFDDIGIYIYTISQINDGQEGIEYDSKEFEIKVTVTAGESSLHASKAIQLESDIVFYNETVVEETTEPEETTEAPEVTTEPEDTTVAPEDTTEAPEETTEPEDTTEAPEDTTEAPEDTTEVPEDTTETPEDTTEAPEDTTEAPEVTTEPKDTTEAPEEEVEITDTPSPRDPAPDTGDNALLIILAAIATLALGVVYFKRRESTED